MITQDYKDKRERVFLFFIEDYRGQQPPKTEICNFVKLKEKPCHIGFLKTLKSAEPTKKMVNDAGASLGFTRHHGKIDRNMEYFHQTGNSRLHDTECMQ
jgi:hypothetical protein